VKKIYLACIYSLGADDKRGYSKDEILEYRYQRINKLAAELMEKNTDHIIFSPITHNHPLSKLMKPEMRVHKYWLAQDKSFLEWCDELWIVRFMEDTDDIEKSKGVRWERRITKRLNKEIVNIKVYPYKEFQYGFELE